MRVVHICFGDTGGAAKAAYRLHLSLQQHGIDSVFFVRRKITGWPGVVVESTEFQGIADKIERNSAAVATQFLRKAILSKECKDLDPQLVPHGFLRKVHCLDPTIVHFHWVDDNVASLREMSTLGDRLNDRVVWTFHDMRAFSCGYYYLGNRLEGWLEQGNPKLLYNLDRSSVARGILHRKVELFGQRRWGCISPSRFMHSAAVASPVFKGALHRHIPYGLAESDFRLIDRKLCRSVLGLEMDKPVIAFGADGTDSPRKGADLLVEALQYLRISEGGRFSNLQFVSFGKGTMPKMDGLRVLALGGIDSEVLLNQVYAAADVFVAPSREDNLPNTVLESLASGTPVAAFDIGGMPDMITSEQIGALAPAFNTEMLAKGIRRFLGLSPEKSAEVRTDCVKAVREKFSSARQAAAVIDLYNLVSEGAKKSG